MFPYYLSIGMSYEQFWEYDPYLVWSYQEAHDLYRSQKNQELYMQGLYNYEAFKSVIDMFAWGFNGGKGSKPALYRDYPHAITKQEKEAEKQRKIEKTLAFIRKGQQ